ncbi:hypothetical protein QQF64_018771, partial [Cirrhinus molitorella]
MALALFSRPQAAGFTVIAPHFQLIICCLIVQSLLMKSAETINCSEPTTDGLLTALKENIFSKTEIRPVINLKTPTNISVTFTLYGILDVFWNIEGLSWDPDECGTDRISIPRKQLWRPDIIINEFVDENKVPETYYLYIQNTGKVVDDLPFHVISSCNLDIYTFPFDIQNCTFTFNSYQHTVLDVQLSFAEPVEETLKNSLSAMTTKGEWELVDMLAEKPMIPPQEMNNSRDTVTYYIVLRRRATLYVVNLLIPSCFLITVDLVSFLLPPQNVDRSAFKMTLILGYTVFLLLMNDLLPVTGNNLPLINAFFSLCLALMVASLLETILIINIQCGSTHGPLPKWAKVLFLNYVARLVRLRKKLSDPEEHTTETKRCDFPVEISQSETTFKTPVLLVLKKISHELLSIRQKVDKHLKTDESSDEWVHLGQVIDRLLFCLYIVFLSVAGFTALLSQFQLIIYCLLIQSFLMKSADTINCSKPTSDALLAALKDSILDKTDVRPVFYQKTPTNISVSFTLYGILGVDEKAQIFDSFIWVYLFWNIEGLSWDPDECGTDRISLPRNNIWMPDIVINEFSCNMDIYTFPFDIQNCTFTFNSYKLTAGDVQLFFVEPVEVTLYTSLSVMKTKGEWELINMLAEKPPIPPEELNITYDTLIYYVILSRRPTMYVVNLLIPSCFLITVDLISFLLPPQNVDRSAFKMTLIFGYTVFLLLMNDLLPVTGNNLPLINAFFSLCFALMVASLLETILITNIQCGSINFGPLPRWAKVLFLNYVARLVCLSKKPSDQNCIPEEHRTGTKHCDPEVEGPQRGAAYQTPVTLELKKISHELLSIREQDWMIEGLSWDPVECGTDRITLPRKKLWRPDIVINEFISDNQAPKTYYVYLNNNGKAEDRLPIHVISSCNLDIYTFPFDIQNCTYTFGSYKHTIRDVQLFFSEPVEATLRKSLQYMETKGEWQLTDMIAGKSSNSSYFNMDGLDRWDELIVLKRRPTLYVVNLLIPSYCLITVDLFSFLLPPQNMDRSAFKMTLILGYTVFLLLMNDLLPVTGDTIPLINVFFSLCLALMVASLLETIIVTNILCGSSDYPPLPNWVKVLFLHYMARLVCLRKKISDQNSDPQSSVESLNCSEPTTKALLTAMRDEVIIYSDARPVISLSTPTNVTVDLTLYGILGVNEKAQVLETYLWVRTRWQIEGLTWDPVECGTKKISLPREKIWVPDVVINE